MDQQGGSNLFKVFPWHRSAERVTPFEHPEQAKVTSSVQRLKDANYQYEVGAFQIATPFVSRNPVRGIHTKRARPSY